MVAGLDSLPDGKKIFQPILKKVQFLPDQHIVGQNTSPEVAGSWLGSSLSAKLQRLKESGL